jgi:hypothetical protein
LHRSLEETAAQAAKVDEHAKAAEALAQAKHVLEEAVKFNRREGISEGRQVDAYVTHARSMSRTISLHKKADMLLTAGGRSPSPQQPPEAYQQSMMDSTKATLPKIPAAPPGASLRPVPTSPVRTSVNADKTPVQMSPAPPPTERSTPRSPRREAGVLADSNAETARLRLDTALNSKTAVQSKRGRSRRKRAKAQTLKTANEAGFTGVLPLGSELNAGGPDVVRGWARWMAPSFFTKDDLLRD